MTGPDQPDTIDGTATDLVTRDRPLTPPPAALFRTEDPVEVIERATAVADALKKVVASRGLISMIQGREHPRVEAWQTLGSMLGVFPVKEWVRPVPWPDVVPEALKGAQARGLAFGFEASFLAQRPDGAVIGGGEALCMRTERTWAGRDDFALKSMAQTRATSKALSSPLRFVMALAGYETTPAEEMGAEPAQTTAPPPTPPPAPSLDEETVGRVREAFKDAAMPHDWLRMHLVAIGVHDVPDGPITLGTLRAMTPKQAEQIIGLCAEVVKARPEVPA